MIVKILKNAGGNFPGVTYNTDKVDKGKGELLVTANFGTLESFGRLRPQDYINYLQRVSAGNTRVRKPQLHVVFSAKGMLYNQSELADTAQKWLAGMGYGQQPYLVIFHRDTQNYHVHAVTTRVSREGPKINAAFEKIRAVNTLDKVLGYEFGLLYQFSTRAQFYLLLETKGFLGKDYNESKLQHRINNYQPDKERATYLRQLLEHHKARSDLISFAKQHLNLDIILHGSEGKIPYGYTIIDHDVRRIFKGSEVLSLKQLFPTLPPSLSVQEVFSPDNEAKDAADLSSMPFHEIAPSPAYVNPVAISDDIDDEAILGRNRHRKRKARTNTR